LAEQAEDVEYVSPLQDLICCAEQGTAGAQFILGFMYAGGDGVHEDVVYA
jgi:TPR repeat protein